MADRRVTVRLSADVSDFIRGINQAEDALRRLRYLAQRDIQIRARVNDTELKLLEERLRRLNGTTTTTVKVNAGSAQKGVGLLLDGILALAPAATAAGSAAGAAMGAIAQGGIVGAASIGTLVLALQGTGDALKALNATKLDPSVANIQKMQEAFAGLSETSKQFVRFMSDLNPVLQHLQDRAADGFLPGLEEGIRYGLRALPEFRGLIDTTSKSMGDMATNAGKALGGPYWRTFITWIDAEAEPTLAGMSDALGNIATGLAGMTMAFTDLNHDTGASIVELTEKFRVWGVTLGQSQGFREWADYVREVGPQLAVAFGALSKALVDVGVAASEMSGVTLGMIEGFAKLISTLSDLPVINGALVQLAIALKTVSLAMALLPAKGATGMAALGRGAGIATLALVGLNAVLPDSAKEQKSLVDQMVRGATESGGLAAGWRKLTADMSKTEKGQRDLSGALDEYVVGATGLKAVFGRTSIWDDENGRLEALKDQYKDLSAQTKAFVTENQALSFEYTYVAAALDEYQQAQARFGDEHWKTTDALGNYEMAVSRARSEQAEFGSEIAATQAHMVELRNQMLGEIDATAAYEEALDNLTASIGENGRGLDLTTEAGRRNWEGLRTLTEATFADLAAKQELGTYTREQLLGLLEQHRARLYDAAVQAGYSETAARNYINQLNLTPEAIFTRVVLDGVDAAIEKMGRLANIMGGLSGTTNINVGRAGQAGNPLTDPLRRSSGGKLHGPGTDTSDSIPLLGSRNEWVINAAESKRQGDTKMALLNAGLAEIVPRGARRLPGGGWVAGDPVRGVRDSARRLAQGGRVDATIRINAQELANTADRWMREYEAQGGRVLQFARAQVGKPYIWGGVGPGGYDCSGFMSALVNVARNRNPYSRVGATANFPWGGFSRGWGPGINIGSTRNAGGGIGHMAGTIGNTNVESAGGTGPRVGGSVGAGAGMFGGNVWHMPFDKGGMLSRAGLFAKNTMQPERVLSPRQTETFEQLVDTMQRIVQVPHQASAAAQSLQLELSVAGGADSAMGTAIQKMVRNGQIKLKVTGDKVHG